MPKVYKSQLIEIVNPGQAGGNPSTKIQFQDQPYLRNKKIYGIEVFTKNDMAVSPTNKTLIDSATFKKSYLTLYSTDTNNVANIGEWLQNIPFAVMHRVQNNVTEGQTLPANPNVQFFDPFCRSMYELTGQIIYWEKCFITLPTAILNTSDVSFVFNVYFK